MRKSIKRWIRILAARAGDLMLPGLLQKIEAISLQLNTTAREATTQTLSQAQLQELDQIKKEVAETKGGVSQIQGAAVETHSHMLVLRREVLDLAKQQTRIESTVKDLQERLLALETLVRVVGSQSGDIRELASRLDDAARRHLEASGGAKGTQAHAAMAEHYGRLASLVSQFWAGQGQLPTDPYPDDDLTFEYATQTKVYDAENDVAVDAAEPSLPWRHLWSDPDCGVFLVLGQSNAANHGETRYTARGEVYTLDALRMRGSRAADPLAGASGTGGSVWSRLGDLLIEQGVYRRVLFVPLAFGGSFIGDWLPGGGRHGRLTLALSRLRKMLGVSILPFSGVLWQQGEAEANHTQMSAKAYKMHFHDLVGELRANGVFAPILVAGATLCQKEANSGRNRDAIRDAQLSLADPAVGILPGPDTDEVGVDLRFDRCHLSEAGLQRCAELWLDAIANHRPLLDKLLPSVTPRAA